MVRDLMLRALGLLTNYQWVSRLYLAILFWNPVADGDRSSARHLLRGIRKQARRLLLGESENVLFRITEQNALEVERQLLLSQNRWHRFARRVSGRANYYQRWTEQSSDTAQPRPRILSVTHKTG